MNKMYLYFKKKYLVTTCSTLKPTSVRKMSSSVLQVVTKYRESMLNVHVLVPK